MNAACVLKRRIAILLSFLLMAACWAADELGVEHKAPLLKIVVDFIDGSSIIGVPSTDSFKLQTDFATLDIPLSQIHRIVMSDDHETVSLELENGDILRGTLDRDRVDFTSALGDISAKLVSITEISINAGGTGGGPAKGLVLHYTFDRDTETIEDRSPSENNGTLHNGTLVHKDGHGKVLSLDGENDRVRIANKPSLEIVSELSLAFAINITSFGPGGYANERAFVINKGKDYWWNPAYALGFSKASGAGKPRWPGKPGPLPALFHVCKAAGAQNGGGKTLSSKTRLESGKWYHVAGTYDGKELRIYINGKLENTASYSGPLRSDNAPVFLGGGNLSSIEWGNHFTANCLLDEVRIYNRALSESEIARLAQLVL